jgi:oligopeptide transport system permease protein
MSGRRALKRFLRHRTAVVSSAIVVILILMAIFGPMVSPYRYDQQNLDLQFSPPSITHPCGTDVLGRDLLTRLMVGARISFVVGFAAAIVSLGIGLIYGAVAGYFGGRLDNLMMRIVDTLYGLPYLAYIILVITFLNEVIKANTEFFKGRFELWNILVVFLALGSISWLTISRIVRGQVLSLKEMEFVEAARALGVGHVRILFGHIVPNLLGPVIVYTTLTMPSIILAESFISFLGLGVQPPLASWGVLISDGAKLINPVKIYWWLLVFPGALLATTLYCLNTIGDGLRDALDVK